MKGEGFRHSIQEGAFALEHGWDPISYLDLEGVELLVAQQVLQVAMDRKAERDRQFMKNMQAAVQNGVGRAFGAK